jgi:hypothetical protein
VKPKPDPETLEILRSHKAEIATFLSFSPPPPPGGVEADQNERHRAELRSERAALREFSGRQERGEGEAQAAREYPCSCGAHSFWVSTSGLIYCAGCIPPVPVDTVSRFELPAPNSR